MLLPRILHCVLALLLALPAALRAQVEQPPLTPMVSSSIDINYANVDGHALLLDLYLPRGVSEPPLLVYVHGGAWRGGSKAANPINTLVNFFGPRGYAVASLDFRLSLDAIFPAQIYDIKAAIRFLRGNAARYGYDATLIGILGSSSGGHLVAMMGVSNGNPLLEGVVGEYLDQSSEVQAVVSYYGASNLTTILSQSTPFGLSVREPALDLLIGGRPGDNLELAKLASPALLADRFAAPLLLLHGDQDPQMPINQSHELHGVYKANYVPVQFEVLHGAAHGGAAFYDEERNGLVLQFLIEHLQ